MRKIEKGVLKITDINRMRVGGIYALYFPNSYCKDTYVFKFHSYSYIADNSYIQLFLNDKLYYYKNGLKNSSKYDTPECLIIVNLSLNLDDSGNNIIIKKWR